MASFYKFYSFVEALAEKVHNLGSDTLKFMLTNDALSHAWTKYADITDLPTAHGYTAGGVTTPQVSSAQSSGTYKLVLTDEVITASGGSVGPFENVVLYNDTASNKEAIGGWDYGSAVTLADTETFTIDTDGTNGVLQIA